MRSPGRTVWGYISAPFLVAVAVGLRLALVGPAAEPETNLLLVAVTVAALTGGLGPGLLAVALAAFQEAWWQMAPIGSLAVSGARDRLELGVFVAAGVFISVAIDRLHRSRDREARAAQALREKEAAVEGALRLALAVEGSRLGAWDWVIGEPTTTVSRRWREIVGVEGMGDVSRYGNDLWVSRIHPEDAPALLSAARELTAGRLEHYDLEYRIRGRDGGWRWVRTRATAVERNVDGTVRRVAGTLADITARKSAQIEAEARERRLRAYVDSPAFGVAITSPGKGWVEVNDRLCEMLGYSREELSRLTWLALTHPDDVAADTAQFDRLRAGELDRYSLDKRFLRKDGTVLWTLLSVSCARRPAGSVDFFVAVLLDIGERKAAEEALRKSEDRFRTYVEAAPLGIFVVDGGGRYQDWNRAALEMIGAEAETMRSLGIADLVDEPDRADAMAHFAALATAGRLDRDYRLRRRDGGHVWVALRGVKLADDRFMAFCQDIGARKKAESEAQERATYLHTILDTALDGFWVVDGEGRLEDVNPAYCDMSGYSREELLQMRIGELDALERPEETAARIARVRQAGFDRFQTRHRRKDGTVIDVAASVRLVDLGRELMVCFFQNVTDRRRAELALVESERRYRTLVTGMASGLVLQSADGTIVDCNPGAERLLGLGAEEMKGRTSVDPRWRALREDGGPFPGEEHPAMVAQRTGRPQSDVLMAVHKPSGEVSWISVNAEPLRDESGKVHAVLSTFVDVTQRRMAEAERVAMQAKLAHAARLAAMGTLVAGVAHEINNPLAAMTANAGTALEEVRSLQTAVRDGEVPGPGALLRQSGDLLEMLEDVTASARRISRIVRDLTILGRPEQRKAPVDLARVVSTAVNGLPAAITRRVEVTAEVVEVPAVAASATQLEQVLVNLISNAALSFPDGRKGQVVVRLGPGAAGAVRVEVSDDGPGIPPELQERIFEPFFTTRPPGQGTGLGLSICNAIVGAHGGTLSVSSAPGSGATFRVELPVAAAPQPLPLH